MLAYILAIALGLGSLTLFLAAFFRPKLHRQDDFLWSGIGLFYALVLWLCAQQLRGGVLLGQVAGVALVLTFGWQTLKLRWAIANPEAIAEIESFSLVAWIQNRLGSLFRKKQPSPPISKTETVAPPIPEIAVEEVAQTPIPTEEAIEEPIAPETVTQERVEETVEPLEPLEPSEPATPEPKVETIVPETISTPADAEIEEEVTSQATPEETTPPETKAQKPTKEGFSLQKLFSFGQQKSKPKPPVSKPESITAALDSAEFDTEGDEIDEQANAAEIIESVAVVEVTDAIATSEAEPEMEVESDIADEKADVTPVIEIVEATIISTEVTSEVTPSSSQEAESVDEKTSDSSGTSEGAKDKLENPSHSPEI
jgi:hypothetical protein